VRLVGYDVQREEAALRLRTYWQALQPMAVDYTIFIHLLGADGDLIVQHDAQPQNGRYPTSIWDVGELVVDEVELSWPPEAAPAQIAIGLYRLDSGERLPVGGGGGETAVILSEPFAPPPD